jgi:hypothetical protein
MFKFAPFPLEILPWIAIALGPSFGLKRAPRGFFYCALQKKQ